MRAIILAGGQGTRLKPYTTCLPKPLMPIGGEMPILEIVIRQLKKHGFHHITLCVNHLANVIIAFFEDGRKWNIKIDYSVEEKPLGTTAPIKLINNPPDNFMVLNGDVFSNINYSDVFDYHTKNNNDITISTYNRKMNVDFGEIQLDENNFVTSFLEKPSYFFQVVMGVNVFNKKILELIPDDKYYGFDNLMNDGISKKLKIKAYKFTDIWYDIGRPYDYDQVNEKWEEYKNLILPDER